MPSINILVIDDEYPIIRGIQKYFEDQKEFQVTATTSPVEGWNLLRKTHFDILVIDLMMPHTDGLTLIRKVRKRSIDIEIIVISGHAKVDDVVSCYKENVLDFLQKPFELSTLTNAIKKSSRYIDLTNKLTQTREEVQFLQLQSNRSQHAEIIGESPAIMSVKELMKRVADFSDMTVVIEGESGTGKELVAQGIHQYSKRAEFRFVPVNCASVPDSIFESEFFGYTKGSFTGANEIKFGYIQHAQGGTLFLDEIGELPLNQQSKLLRILETGKYHQIGRPEIQDSNVRVIVATNRPLADLVAEKRIREDLYYRLSQFTVTVPPLRQRKEDIPALFDFFSTRFCVQYNKQPISIPASTYKELMEYDYPGNVRELKNLAERAVILSQGEMLAQKLFPVSDRANSQLSNEDCLLLSNIEKIAIQKAIAKARSSRMGAAELLGITPQTLDRKLLKHGITLRKNPKI